MTEAKRSKSFRTTDLNLSPMLVFYEVTQACGLVCRHCRACAQTEAHPDELSTRAARRLINQLSEFPEPPMLVFTGGDPLCRNDIFRLIEHATALGLATSITPAATPLVTRDALDRLKHAGIGRVAISIDAANADAHDRIRGVKGSFARSLEILKDAERAGLSTQVNTTLTPENVGQIADLADLLTPYEIAMWSVFFLVPVGRAEYADRLTACECERAFQQLWDEAQRQPYLIKTTEAPHYRRFALQQRQWSSTAHGSPAVPFRAAGLNDGKGVLFVGHKGEIHPSGFMPIDCGQFPRQNVVQVYQESPVFQDLRNPNRLEGKCRKCEYRTICGGSRARAYALSGNPLSEEPDCAYIPPAIHLSAP